ncbi:MAG: response regulator transcription factor [Bacteroidetes bacterium]|nr:response regulator transcription factor [Bacteroidota bacterium]
MQENAKILLVDDDPDILEFLAYNLKKEGYDVAQASNGKEALKAAEKFSPDLILLDVMMPEMDGIATCQALRNNKKFANVFIIFLTARIEEYSEIAGFSAGADDYINKPIKPGALVSRVKAMLKRKAKPEPVSQLIQIGDLIIDRGAYEVIYKNKKFHFARKEFELLFLLASHPGKVFIREDILETVWGNEVFVGDRTIDVHIRKIREKINPDFIKTIKGIGYKFDPS